MNIRNFLIIHRRLLKILKNTNDDFSAFSVAIVESVTNNNKCPKVKNALIFKLLQDTIKLLNSNLNYTHSLLVN